VLPWAILGEVDLLIGTHVSAKAQDAFLADLADEVFTIAWGDERDIDYARKISDRYRALRLGLVDAVVIATAVRAGAEAIATLDLRHFAAVEIPGRPKLFPRDLSGL
jgi:predicted nucleic acid-binding protein